MARFAVLISVLFSALVAGQEACIPGADCEATGNVNLLQTSYDIKLKSATKVQPTCKGNRFKYDAGYGNCDSYAVHNRRWCHIDEDFLGDKAEDVCPQCDKCIIQPGNA